ncbi:hypothetical protein BHE74_00003271 [Ensete ventricosum]|nr:hypothetical protein BHE74_00003271 [Ensete ventricosum]
MRLRAFVAVGGEEETRKVRCGAAVVAIDDSGCNCGGRGGDEEGWPVVGAGATEESLAMTEVATTEVATIEVAATE